METVQSKIEEYHGQELMSTSFVALKGKTGNHLQAQVGKWLILLSAEERVKVGLDANIASAQRSIDVLQLFISKSIKGMIYQVTDIKYSAHRIAVVTFSKKGEKKYWHDLENFKPIKFDWAYSIDIWDIAEKN